MYAFLFLISDNESPLGNIVCLAISLPSLEWLKRKQLFGIWSNDLIIAKEKHPYYKCIQRQQPSERFSFWVEERIRAWAGILLAFEMPFWGTVSTRICWFVSSLIGARASWSALHEHMDSCLPSWLRSFRDPQNIQSKTIHSYWIIQKIITVFNSTNT